ncbi:hypothetical protein Lepto7376_3918 [[Leptolyngbya] sp. PCC 7376]|uniref:hypothetical protein n=1 Tax=[Leptolyngbya] sp. PCC 7376 TaxID=111781 RepID=UPI00029F2C73|nr:hypothetical protein [[Leptolyngbya] sp. PCC 7376]AFY40067.1 hypothetical protein Lepto7376_3918 [[Leptolyngbya] sp. PCC 7376]
MENTLQTPADILDKVSQPSFTIAGAAPVTTPLPALPRLKATPITQHHHKSNPHFVLDVLQNLEQYSLRLVDQLKETQRKIQDLYLEGPLLDGWLQSATTGQKESTDKVLTPAEMGGGYCLCGLDEFGKLWSKPCPVEEVPSVSLAIARYHRLKKLLATKQEIEQKLKDLTETLEGIPTE